MLLVFFQASPSLDGYLCVLSEQDILMKTLDRNLALKNLCKLAKLIISLRSKKIPAHNHITEGVTDHRRSVMSTLY